MTSIETNPVAWAIRHAKAVRARKRFRDSQDRRRNRQKAKLHKPWKE